MFHVHTQTWLNKGEEPRQRNKSVKVYERLHLVHEIYKLMHNEDWFRLLVVSPKTLDGCRLNWWCGLHCNLFGDIIPFLIGAVQILWSQNCEILIWNFRVSQKVKIHITVLWLSHRVDWWIITSICWGKNFLSFTASRPALGLSQLKRRER